MAPIKQTTNKPVVERFVESLNSKTADTASEAEKEKQVEERVAQVRGGELASQLDRTPAESNKANRDTKASPSPVPRTHSHQQQMVEINGGAAPSAFSRHGDDDHPTSPLQPYIATVVPSSSMTRIQQLESEIFKHNDRIGKLEADRQNLIKEIADLKKRRNEAERERDIALAEGEEAKKKHAELEASLRQRIEELTRDRTNADREIDELNDTVTELRKQLNKERNEMSMLEEETKASETTKSAEARSNAAASSRKGSTRRGSVVENEKKKHGHRRNLSLGLPTGLAIEFKIGEDKEKQKKKGSHK